MASRVPSALRPALSPNAQRHSTINNYAFLTYCRDHLTQRPPHLIPFIYVPRPPVPALDAWRLDLICAIFDAARKYDIPSMTVHVWRPKIPCCRRGEADQRLCDGLCI